MTTNAEFLQTAVDAARSGAEVLRQWAGKFTAREKSPADLVTEADLESQRTIEQIIHNRFPDHAFLGEENDPQSAGKKAGRNGGYRWIVDPLDGTSNYVHRFPYYSVSIGLEQDGELLAAAVFDPNRDEMFTATRGGGAYLNGGAIEPSSVERLSEALVVVSLPAKVSRTHFTVQRLLAVLDAAQHVQRTGSAALNLCYVSCGRIDAFFSSSLKPWDIAAGLLIVAEVGGGVTDSAGGAIDLMDPDLLSSNGTALHGELQTVLQSADLGA